MTLAEYLLRMKAFELKRLDALFLIHQQAWANAQAQATDKDSKPIYKEFIDFFDYEQREKEILGTKEKLDAKTTNELTRIAKNVIEYRKQKGG